MKIDWSDEFLTLGKLLVVAAQLAVVAAIVCFAILATDFPASWADAIRGTMN